MSPHHVLWTAGWDSTYRVLDLVLTHRRPVQPHYVVGQSRHSKSAELRAQRQIRSALARHDPTAAALLLETRHHRHEDIPPDEALTEALRSLKARAFIGWQYEWLARLARSLDLDLELSIHGDDKASAFLQGYVERRGEGSDAHYVLMASADDDLLPFRRFRFPIFELTKLQMSADAERHGWADLLELTWFCHTPALGRRPCGVCNPCKYTRDEGLARRVPPDDLPRRLSRAVAMRSRQLAWRSQSRAAALRSG